METGCRHIDQAIKFALKSGNKIYHVTNEGNGNEKKVIDMYDPLPPELKKEIDNKCLNLRYWEFTGVPHNPFENGYTCDECNVVLIFSNVKTPRL